ncbi:MFS general substrate transporter [Hypoxylon sp. FL1150]|nr:MFS general substrate transporter [Hypoxylon sp. FL1150]
MNFPTWKKWAITFCMAFVTLVITFASSVFSTATLVTAKEFRVSTEVMTLGTSLFVLGFAFGPLVWAPLSELFGRKTPLLSGYFVFAVFQIPVAVSQNVYTIMISRFFGGLFGSTPFGIVGGAMVDIWVPLDRGIAMSLFGGATFVGPVAGPIVGGFIVDSYLGWRWTAWITLIMAAFFGTIALFFLPETHAPTLLKRRAQKLRFATRDWALHSFSEEEPVNINTIVFVYLLRPWKMLILEPILLLITIYMAFAYGILYLLFEAYPISFQEERGWNNGVGALPFLAITVGVVSGASLVIYVSKTRYERIIKESGRLQPEERLIPMMIGAVLFPAGLFWFAWTSDPKISWVPQVLSGIFIGTGVMTIFLQGLNYIIDVYLMNSNSATAANGLLRAACGAGFPLFATAMYDRLGVEWATSLLGFIAVALIPVPLLFYIYGPKIRKMSRFSPHLPAPAPAPAPPPNASG